MSWLVIVMFTSPVASGYVVDAKPTQVQCEERAHGLVKQGKDAYCLYRDNRKTK